MATLPGLHKRGGIYQLRVVIPLDLRQHFGRAKIVQSLQTSCNREAKLAGAQLRASLLADFAARRGTTPQPAPEIHRTARVQPHRPQQHPTATALDKPAPTADGEAAKHWSLRQVFGKWKNFERRSADATRANELALIDFETWLGNSTLPIHDITRPMGVDFKSWLVGKVEAGEYAGKTAHMRLVNVCALLRFAHQDLELLPRQPWRGLSIDYRTESPRRPWSDSAIKAFFSQPLFQAYELPKQTKAGADAAYWIPLLGLYTGATVSELAQLRVVDIEVNSAGEGFIHFTESSRQGQQLKTEQRARSVPLHSTLVRLGILEYTRQIQASGSDRLWPKLRLREGKPGGFFSQWFNGFRRSIPDCVVPDFHSLRHTVRSLMTEADFDANIQDRITGHGVRGSAGVRVYTHPTQSLRRAVEAIRYTAVQLPRTFRRT